MLYRYRDRQPFAEIQPDIERLQGLVRDLERIRHGEHPDAAALAAAPILDVWSLAKRSEACLVGRVTGHPRIHDGRVAVTSGLWLLAPGLGYARSLNRFYRLGPASESCTIGQRLS